MNYHFIKVAGLLRIIVFAWGWLVFFPSTNAAQIGIKIPLPPRVIALFEPETFGLERLAFDSTLTKRKPNVLKRSVQMDSTLSYVSFSEAVDKTEFNFPAVVDLDTYIQLRLEFETRELWKKTIVQNLRGKVERSAGAIELDIPFRIKSKTFTRIFGSDRIGLRVTGNITFDLSGRTEDRSGSAISALESQNTFSPRFRQTQQFTVEGKIGEKVTVSVEQNSEATVDIENTLKLRYDGDEDEIVQKIEAGNISLSLPSTKYVIFGGSNKGLFGLKSEMKIGNLNFTAIASLEKGQQQELSISGSSSETKAKIKDTDFIKNRYFFIDEFYRQKFEQGLAQDPQTFTYTAGRDIIQLDIYESIGYTDQDSRYGAAILEPWTVAPNGDYSGVTIESIPNLDALANEGKAFKGYFKRLEFGRDYSFDKYRGFFTLNQTANDNSALAVAYIVSQPRDWPQVGTLIEDLADTNQALILKLIKPKNMQPSNVETWPLMMRNVYSLGGTNIEQEGFDVRLQYNVTGNEQTYPEGIDRSFLNLLGLDLLNENGDLVEGGDEIIDNNPYVVNRAEGTLIFPALQPFNPDEDSRFKDKLPDKYRVDMYNISNSNTQAFLSESKFEMIVTSRSTKSTFDLGFYVLEGSEVVTLGGRTLQRDKDYIIDYFSGQLTLLSNEAKRSSSSLQIKYERANLFQLDKKTIFGGRLEYKFWENSFVGLTALYLNKSTLDRRVRVGQEPFSNFVWDINAAMQFKPRIITRALDWLPLIETNAESNIDIEGEFAQVLPNPNTLNSGSTGDNEGVAYIDDFEASKRTTTLGIRYRTWSAASPPKILPSLEENGEATPVDSVVNKFRANMAWFNPYNQTLIKDIWPNRDVNAQTGQTTDVLGVDMWRDPDSDPLRSWVGMMRSTISFADQQKTKYIELWINGFVGTVNVDIGRISEDWYMKGRNLRGESSYGNLNTEDKNNNGLLDEGEDSGIDGIANGRSGDDERDNWNEPQRGALNVYDGVSYDGINGTEGNSNSREARYPDTEDLDGDGQLSTVDEYFEYSFSLDPTDPKHKPDWIAGETEKGWRLFRIPLNEPSEVVGRPDKNFQQIFNVRLWFSDLPTERTRLRIATFDFVGNEWEEIGIADNDTASFVKNDTLFSLATYNTEENAEDTGTGIEPYKSPPGVSGVRDRITRARSKEQSLVMRFGIREENRGLKAGQIAEAKKTLFSALDLLNYRRMRMFINGDWQQLPEMPPSTGAPEDSSKIRFYLRFGSDANNYYEYGQDVYNGWNTRYNNIDIDLDELAKIKAEEIYYVGTNDRPEFQKYLDTNPGAYYRSVGLPSLKTIRYFIIGVKHLGDQPGRDESDFVGEIWLDELRLSEVRKESATALRLNTSVRLADLLSFNAQWESTDADFHNVSTQFGGGNTEERQNYSGKFTLDKFLPDAWDLSIPIDARASFSRSIPKYRPRTDELTGYQNNSLDKKLRSLFGLRDIPEELQSEVAESEVFGVGTTIQKRSKSKFWLLRYTFDEIAFDFDYSLKNNSNWELLYNKSEQYKESFKYRIPFGRENFFQPFTFVSKIPVLKKISDQKLFYTPSDLNFSLNITDSESRTLRRSTGDVQNEVKRQVTVASNRAVSASYKMLNSLDFSYSRSWNSDADFDSLTHQELLKNIITRWNFGLDTDINQSFKANYKPSLLGWLGTDMSFTNNFTHQLTNGNQYTQSSNRTQKRIGLDFSPNKLMKAIYTPKSSPSQTTRSRRPSRGKQTENESDKQEPPEEKKEKGSKFPNPLMWIYNGISSLQNIKTTYTVDDKIDHKYLVDIPRWDYQFGFTRNPGVAQDSSLIEQNINLIGPRSQKTVSLRTTTSMNLTSNIKASFSHDLAETESYADYGKTRSGSKSSSYFVTGDDPLKDFTDLTSWRAFIPDWNVQISGVEKFLFFSQFAQSISLDHAHSGKYSENLALKLDGSFLPTNQSFNNNWQPLVGVNIRTKWGVSGNVRVTNSTAFQFSSGAGASKTVTDAFSVSLTYSKTAGFKIPIPVWPFKGKTFKNEINFNLTFDSSNNQTFQKQFGSDKFEEKQKNSTWKLRPSATYRFSQRVQGSLFYERGTSENKISGKYSYNEFGINVNIAIRD